MLLKSKITNLTILLIFLFPALNTFPNSFQENPLTKAIQLFDKQKFIEAESAFKKLIDDRPDDFMINYFYGACRTENGNYSKTELNILLKASKEVYPLDIDYYLGAQYHAENQWDKALSHYTTYKKVATNEEKKRVKLDERIEQCANQINPFAQSEIDKKQSSEMVTDSITPETISIANTNETASAKTEVIVDEIPVALISEEKKDSLNTEEISQIETTNNQIVDSSVVEQLPKPEIIPISNVPKQAEEVIKFNINSEITYLFASNFKTAEGGTYYKEAVAKQNQLNTLVNITEIQRSKYSDSKIRAEKDSIGQIIVDLESESYDLSKVVKQLFMQAKLAENAYWQNVTLEDAEKFINEMNAAELNLNKVKKDETLVAPSSKIIVLPVDDINSATVVYKPPNKSSGITYKIQLWAYSKGIPAKVKPLYTKISLIRQVDTYTDENGVVVYTTGNLIKYDDAAIMLNQVNQEGVKDAQIAAYLNGKRIPLEQARKTENNK